MPSTEKRDVGESAAPVTTGFPVEVELVPRRWLLASLGKTVLHPGGPELTERILNQLRSGCAGDVFEIAPGLGMTAQLTLERQPYGYTAVKWDDGAALNNSSPRTRPELRHSSRNAENSGLPNRSFTIVYEEAVLTMRTQAMKLKILHESNRILQPGGWFGVHELCIAPSASERIRYDIEQRLAIELGVRIRPLMSAEWRNLFGRAGFQVLWEGRAPMQVSESPRMVTGTRLGGALRLLSNVFRDDHSSSVRAILHSYHDYLEAVAFVCRKEMA